MNANDFLKIIEALYLSGAPAGSDEPDSHKGVRVALQGRGITLNALQTGQSTEIKLFMDAYAGEDIFFVPHNDFHQFKRVLRLNLDAPVVLRESVNTLTNRPCLEVCIDNWFTAFLGGNRSQKWPLRSHGCKGRPATTAESAVVMRALKPLSAGPAPEFDVKLANDNKETVITVVQPLPSIISVKSYLY